MRKQSKQQGLTVSFSLFLIACWAAIVGVYIILLGVSSVIVSNIVNSYITHHKRSWRSDE